MTWIGNSDKHALIAKSINDASLRIHELPDFHFHAIADGIQKLFTCFGKWNAKLDLKKVLVKPSPHPAIAAPIGLA